MDSFKPIERSREWWIGIAFGGCTEYTNAEEALNKIRSLNTQGWINNPESITEFNQGFNDARSVLSIMPKTPVQSSMALARS